ncbi:hypothetical protein CLW00_106262 [Mongoliibacter ruber]|uniref:Uncharacterized protein n=1 Tax=Mongoliibacter ruber TaxID=1750599 RepID=A0A2T0WLS7_9BACT|nr:hypothetical protein CLW00_106262 [Mongoliibacter ruber]
MKLYNNLNTYGTGPSGPAIALTGGSSEIAHIFFGSIDSRNTFLDNYYYARKAVHLENLRNRGK